MDEGLPIFVVMQQGYPLKPSTLVLTQPYIAVGWYYISALVPPSPGSPLSYRLVLRRVVDGDQPGTWNVATLDTEPGGSLPPADETPRADATSTQLGIPDKGYRTLWVADTDCAKFEDAKPVLCRSCHLLHIVFNDRTPTKPAQNSRITSVPRGTCVSMCRTAEMFPGTPFQSHKVNVYFLPCGGKVFHIRYVDAPMQSERVQVTDLCLELLKSGNSNLRRGKLKCHPQFDKRYAVKDFYGNQFLSAYHIGKATIKKAKRTGKKSKGEDKDSQYEFATEVADSTDLASANEGIQKAAKLLDALCPEANFNHVLHIGYLRGQRMNFHTDDEPDLKSPVATMTLGHSATMKFRLRQNFKKGKENRPPRAPRLVLDGKEIPEVDPSGVIKCPIQHPPRDLTGLKASAQFKILMQHGDIVIMDGDSVQAFYEHEIDDIAGVRHAITMRRLEKPGLLSFKEI
ncbi:hypothetical protein HDU96_009783 [Phlyctochytrium bullatum]|nr:hypothetical protein HDU96_009783 [Phlyctochytrium bullatum]